MKPPQRLRAVRARAVRWLSVTRVTASKASNGCSFMKWWAMRRRPGVIGFRPPPAGLKQSHEDGRQACVPDLRRASGWLKACRRPPPT